MFNGLTPESKIPELCHVCTPNGQCALLDLKHTEDEIARTKANEYEEMRKELEKNKEGNREELEILDEDITEFAKMHANYVRELRREGKKLDCPYKGEL